MGWKRIKPEDFKVGDGCSTEVNWVGMLDAACNRGAEQERKHIIELLRERAAVAKHDWEVEIDSEYDEQRAQLGCGLHNRSSL